ncbi:hypothetical protein FQR65_LT19684 [Abscondita terminalis]|nr:hypothetical protein FQR65_LT19684 [Abscondita terminalis]
MGLLQELNEKSFTRFDNLGDLIFKRLLKIFQTYPDCLNLTIIFDRYDFENSIKIGERQRRGQNVKIRSYSIVGSRNVPNYKEFLKSNTNKISLIRFVTQYLRDAYNKLPNSKVLVIGGGLQNGEACLKITNAGSWIDEILKCNHEEADTLIIFHIRAEKSVHKRIVVKSDDTDVLILLLHYYNCDANDILEKVYMEKGHSSVSTSQKRFIPIHTLAHNLGNSICNSLPAFHALTGCDTTNSLFKIGKNSAFNVLSKNVNNMQLHHFGKTTISESITVARKFILHLYKQESAED